MAWWVFTRHDITVTETSIVIIVDTSTPDHLFTAWAYHSPRRAKIFKNIRGKLIHCGYEYIWDTPFITEQVEYGDTYTHTFYLENLTKLSTIWWYSFAPDGPYGLEIQGPLLHRTLPGVVPTGVLFEDTDHAHTLNMNPPGFDNAYNGRKFLPTQNGWITRGYVWMEAWDDEPEYTIKMQIRQSANGHPRDAILETSATTIHTVHLLMSRFEFIFAGVTPLIDLEDYWVVLYRTDAVPKTIKVRCRVDHPMIAVHNDTGIIPWDSMAHEMDLRIEGITF